MEQQLPIQHRFGFGSVQLVKSSENLLGKGSYGSVYRAHCDQLVCAAKVLHPKFMDPLNLDAQRIVERFRQEIELLSGLRHPNIIQYLFLSADPETHLPVLFMELMDESLTSFLGRPENHSLPLHVQVDIAHDVAQALSHLHHHDILHRDLSSNNVLMIGSRRAKVTDFGMAKLLDNNPSLAPTRHPGTAVYMSPQALAKPPTYTRKLDIFSCGVLIIQIITRRFPNPGLQTCAVQMFPSGQALRVVPELERRKEHLDLIPPSHPLLEIALACLKDMEEQRLTAEQLCSCLISLKGSGCLRRRASYPLSLAPSRTGTIQYGMSTTNQPMTMAQPPPHSSYSPQTAVSMRSQFFHQSIGIQQPLSILNSSFPPPLPYSNTVPPPVNATNVTQFLPQF